MRHLMLLGCVICLANAGPASAQTTTLIGGETRQVVANVYPYGSCYVGRGQSAFQRDGTATKAFMTFDELWYGGQYDLSGQADLVFSTSNSGKILFKNLSTLPITISQPGFSNYTQTYIVSKKRLQVSFTINFPACGLDVAAVYDGG